jgi:hypothetical protein
MINSLKNITLGKKYVGKFLYTVSPPKSYLFYSIHNMVEDDQAIDIVEDLYGKINREIILFEAVDKPVFDPNGVGFLIRFKYEGREESERIHAVCYQYEDLQYQFHYDAVIPAILTFSVYECIYKMGDIKMKPRTRKHFGDIFDSLD